MTPALLFWSKSPALACFSRRRHKHCEQPYVEHLATLADGACCADDSARMIVVSWLVEVAEEFGLQQETLHAAVAMLDRFLSSSNVSCKWNFMLQQRD